MSWQGPIGDKAQQSNLEPYTIADAVDFGDVPTASQDGYAIVWDNSAGKFVLGTAGVSDHGALTGLADDDHTQYLLATGSRTGASSSLQAFTSGVITGIVRPASDSTTAFRVQNAAGSSSVLTADTANSRLSVNGASLAGAMTVYSTPGQPQMFLGNVGRVYATQIRSTSIVGSGIIFDYDVNLLGSLNGSSTAERGAGLRIDTRAGQPAITFQIRPASASYPGGVEYSVLQLSDTAGATVDTEDTGTATVANIMTIRRRSSNTPNTNFGLGILAALESSTTINQSAGRIQVLWNVATHASRAADMVHTVYYTSTEQEFLRGRGDAGGVQLGFYGVTPVARQVLATGAGASVDDVITALQNLGLVKQS